MPAFLYNAAASFHVACKLEHDLAAGQRADGLYRQYLSGVPPPDDHEQVERALAGIAEVLAGTGGAPDPAAP